MAKRILQMLAALVAAILFILAMLYSGVIPGRERLSAVADASLGEQTPIPTPTPEETRRPAAFIPLEDTEDSVMPLVATIPAAPLAAGALPAAAAAPIAPAAAPVAAAPAAAPAPITAQAPIAPVGQGVHVVDNALPIKAVDIGAIAEKPLVTINIPSVGIQPGVVGVGTVGTTVGAAETGLVSIGTTVGVSTGGAALIAPPLIPEDPPMSPS